MATHSAEEARKKFESLPPEIKSLIYSPEMTFVMQQIGQKNQLHLDQIDILNNETGQVMLGFIEPKDFAAELMESLSIDRMKVDSIVQDINDMLFVKIREQMKKIYEQNEEARSAEVLTPTREKSVIMPSTTPAIKPTPPPAPPPPKVVPATPPTSVVIQKISTPPAAPTPAPAPKPAVATATPKPPPPPPSAPASPPPAPVTPPAPTSQPKPSPKSGAEVMLSETTVSMPKEDAPKTPLYKADPYREPPE